MIGLALDTSGSVATVAVMRAEDGRSRVLGRVVVSGGMRHGVDLFPAVERALRAAAVEPREVRLVAVGTGPGSYTGLRLGITAARSFAYAAGAELFGVPSCDAWAAATPLPGERGPHDLAVVLDARTRAVYLALYRAGEGGWERVAGPELVEPADAAARVPREARIVGDGIAPYAEAFGGLAADALPERAEAADVGRLAFLRRARGEHDAIDAVVPLYLRRPEAELRKERTDG